jgi:poly-gamma-glutamate synthesis protein (capsule biosynthesis protein)
MTEILFLGDVYLQGFHEIGRLFDRPYVLNLEAPFCAEEKPIPGKINLGMQWKDFSLSFKRPPLAVCLANNHVLDYGAKGLAHTLNLLSCHKILAFGAGAAEHNYQNPLLMDLDGQRIAFFGYCSAKPCLESGSAFGPAPLMPDRILRDIDAHRANADRLIVNLHWGVEEASFPNSTQVNLARQLIDAGVHAIIGHHSHSIQPVESYAHGVIAYGLGNFVFPDLSLPAFYNTNGKHQRIYKKKQRKWNRSSIGLMINLRNMAYDIKYFVQDGSQTREKKNSLHATAHKTMVLKSGKLDAIAARHLYLRKLNIMTINFLRSPSLRKLINFIRHRGIRQGV